MVKGFHKLFKAVENELNNTLDNLVELVSEVSHFIQEPKNFSEISRLPEDVKKSWLKATLKEIKI